MRKFKLFVDDTREFPSRDYECCRLLKHAKIFLDIIQFDFITLDYSLSGGETGIDILNYMKANNIFVPNINIHSNNIFGREQMRNFCKENFPDSKITMNMLPK
ncbi:MAG: hypothetical protein IJN56_03750 [Clostridia bacterium]|nr:hypothetical protein [Clostridia bacterium]